MYAHLAAGRNADKLTLLQDEKWKQKYSDLTAEVSTLRERLSEQEVEIVQLKMQSSHNPNPQCSPEVGSKLYL